MATTKKSTKADLKSILAQIDDATDDAKDAIPENWMSKTYLEDLPVKDLQSIYAKICGSSTKSEDPSYLSSRISTAARVGRAGGIAAAREVFPGGGGGGRSLGEETFKVNSFRATLQDAERFEFLVHRENADRAELKRQALSLLLDEHNVKETDRKEITQTGI